MADETGKIARDVVAAVADVLPEAYDRSCGVDFSFSTTSPEDWISEAKVAVMAAFQALADRIGTDYLNGGDFQDMADAIRGAQSLVDAPRLAFIVESNRIEGIHRRPTDGEIEAHEHFWALDTIAVADLEDFVREVAARPLRRSPGQNVRVGAHLPPPGGLEIEVRLRAILVGVNGGHQTPFETHQRYEHLHPFLDGNGRSGRALWAWQMMREGRDPFALPFLHLWYYQSLDGYRLAYARSAAEQQP